MGPIENPWHSRPIDVHRRSDHRQVGTLVEGIWAECFTDKVTSGPKPKTSFKNQLRVLILDLYVAWLEDPTLSIGLSMSSNAWDTNSRYNAIHLSKKLIPIIHTLHEAGLLDLARGSYGGKKAGGNRTTRIRASRKLQERFSQMDEVSRDDIAQSAAQEVTILRSKEERQIEYTDTARTNRMRSELLSYNAVLAEAFIDIPVLDEPRYREVITDHHHKRTHRVFNRGEWNINGRFYGGWWQQLSSNWRQKIFINDTPVVKADFSGMHVALLGLQAGQPIEGDPYALPEHDIWDLPAVASRAVIKKLVLTAINANSKDSAYRAFRQGFPEGHVAKRFTDAQLTQAIDLFLQRNPQLDGLLCSDKGVYLMHTDSLIAEKVHKHFTDLRIPVLSVHDSFIIDYTHVEELKAVMSEASEEVVGAGLATSNTYFGLDEPSRGRSEEVTLDYINWRQTARCLGYLDRLKDHEERTGRAVVPYRV